MYIHQNDEIITIKVEFRVLYTPFGVRERRKETGDRRMGRERRKETGDRRRGEGEETGDGR